MATSDLTFLVYFSWSVDISLLIIYSLFIYKIRSSLERNAQKINNYMKATLICFGISAGCIKNTAVKLILIAVNDSGMYKMNTH